MPIFESLIIIAVFIVGASILISSIKLGISPMPSSKKAYQAIVSLADETGDGAIYDLGSGWGNLVIRLAKAYPERQIVGYELSYFPYLITNIIKSLLRLNNLVLYRENYLKADLSKASVLTCYLFPKAMEDIESKLANEENDVRFVISNNFALPSHQPCKVLELMDFYRSPVYLYCID